MWKHVTTGVIALSGTRYYEVLMVYTLRIFPQNLDSVAFRRVESQSVISGAALTNYSSNLGPGLLKQRLHRCWLQWVGSRLYRHSKYQSK